MATKVLILYILLLALFACSSTESKERDWVETGVALTERKWRWCSALLDRPEYVDKGWCWKGEETKNRIWPLSNLKRVKPYFCAFADVDCMRRNGLDQKQLVSP